MAVENSSFIQDSIEYTKQDIRDDTRQIAIDVSLLAASVGFAGAGVNEILSHKNLSDGLTALGISALLGTVSSTTFKDDIDAWLNSNIKLANLKKLSDNK